tara:strand:- start:417 stop:842 length:426 start_codon:yes stop_codon:yes gene_type:complete
MKKINGSCLCKNISFEIFNECRYSVLCHCTMCQKSNAEFSNYTKVQKKNFKFKNKKTLKWFNSSKSFKRGFCSKCGSSLFFQSRLSDLELAVSTGSLNSSVPVKGHIYYEDKKSTLTFTKGYKKFRRSHDGYFDKFIYKIK